ERQPDKQTLLRQEHVRLNVREIVREQDAGQARDGSAEREGLHLEAKHGLAGDGGHDFVLADRATHATERRAAYALEDDIDECDAGEYEGQIEDVVMAAEAAVQWARDRGDAVGATGQPRLVQQEQP